LFWSRLGSGSLLYAVKVTSLGFTATAGMPGKGQISEWCKKEAWRVFMPATFV
jgi:hypothetical protein